MPAASILWYDLHPWLPAIIAAVLIGGFLGHKAVVGWRRAGRLLAELTGTREIGRIRTARTFTQDDKIKIAAASGGRCQCPGCTNCGPLGGILAVATQTRRDVCGEVRDLQYDHIRPWSKGGNSVAANGQLLCGPCNRAKGAHRT